MSRKATYFIIGGTLLWMTYNIAIVYTWMNLSKYSATNIGRWYLKMTVCLGLDAYMVLVYIDRWYGTLRLGLGLLL